VDDVGVGKTPVLENDSRRADEQSEDEAAPGHGENEV
jgi:hypothetical protein